MQHDAAPTREFLWPPRSSAENASHQSIIGPGVVVPARSSRWSQIERAWLAPSSPHLAERIAAAGWAPDAFGVFCDRCASTVGPGEADEFGCSLCADRRVPWRRAVRLGEFDADLREWVHEVKFTRFHALGVALGAMLGERVRDAGVSQGAHGKVAVVPAPMSWRRRVFRGVDHSRGIALGVARTLEAPLVEALSRRHRPSQLSVPASERARNLVGAVRRRPGVDFTGWTVVLVDDVRTTGATLAACARALRRGPGRPAAVWTATLAVTPDRGRLGLVGIPQRNRAKHGGDSGLGVGTPRGEGPECRSETPADLTLCKR